MRVGLPAVMRNRDFSLYWVGIVASEVGVRGTFAVNLLHVFLLTGSTLMVGFVGLFRAIALLGLSPLGGVYADRLDRRRLLQLTQGLSLVVSLGLGLLTFAGVVEAWHVFVSVLLNSAAATFDRPARQALIPALVSRGQLVHAFALVNPSREIAMLVGPALGGLLVAISGPELMYFLDAGTYGVLLGVLALLRIGPLEGEAERPSVLSSIRVGLRYVTDRPIIWQLMALDLSATLFGAWRVVMPEVAVDILEIGSVGYGILNAAPPAGALLGTAVIFRMITRSRSGHLVLASTIGYGLACILFVQSTSLPFGGAAIAFMGALAIGGADAIASAVRHAAVQLETPESLRGRVTSLYQMSSGGGPSLGEVNVGWIASALGPVGALTFGGFVPVVVGTGFLLRGGRVRDYRVPEPQG